MPILPAILIAAYNRPESLIRLLESVAKIETECTAIPLVISIDKSDSLEVLKVAQDFEWKYGSKEIITHPQNLGLRQHILSCGDLTQTYETIILLEDDLIVSPYFYDYAQQAQQYYTLHSQVQGISLYSYQIAENRFFPFYPIPGDADVHFIQMPSSWGEVFSRDKWVEFRTWYDAQKGVFDETQLPEYVQEWGESSWKKKLANYMLLNKKYFVFPNISYSTNFSEPGVNSDRKGLFQVPLSRAKKELKFTALQDSISVYDAWFEISPESVKKLEPKFAAYVFEVDLHGTKKLENCLAPYLLSSKKCAVPVLSFGNDMPDSFQNILSANKGSFYSLGETTDFENSTTDIAHFYPNINPIRDIVWSAKHSEMQKKFDFEQKNPTFFIGIFFDGDYAQLSHTLHSIEKQNYPVSQIELVIFCSCLTFNLEKKSALLFHLVLFNTKEQLITCFTESVNASRASYFTVLPSGDTFYEFAFDSVNKIFTKYADINWLTGIETLQSKSGYGVMYGNTSVRRWNERIFERDLYKKTARQLSPSTVFWRKHTWQSAQQYLYFVSTESFFSDLWLAFFKVLQLHTCDVYLSSAGNNTKPKTFNYLNNQLLVEDTFINKIQEFFFVNNVPYLRLYYKTKNNLAPVVRFDFTTQNYYLSDY